MSVKQDVTGAFAPPKPARRRLSLEDRERQILDKAIEFFSEHGLSGQMRELARSAGITHALLYHYFPTKQALIERVYLDLFEGRWKQEYEVMLDAPGVDPVEKIIAFYWEYFDAVLTREFVRIYIFSGLTDHYIPDRFVSLLHIRLFPRLIRESRKLRGSVSRGKATDAEFEHLMGLHGGIFHTSMRRFVYEQNYGPVRNRYDRKFIEARVRAYAASLPFAV
ncbi:TetR/AcrR family transcriptional regulator [Variovorax paradoxus]|uniref:TetR/AcrR family transcriptional regulator n=1 Tax=Variovorax paradoxus TaxID=34073 RepID=UPI00247AE8AB